MKYKQTGTNSWTIEVQENGKTKALFIEFPQDALNQVGWDVGDTLIWEELDHGAWSIKKKDLKEPTTNDPEPERYYDWMLWKLRQVRDN